MINLKLAKEFKLFSYSHKEFLEILKTNNADIKSIEVKVIKWEIKDQILKIFVLIDGEENTGDFLIDNNILGLIKKDNLEIKEDREDVDDYLEICITSLICASNELY